MGYYIPSSVSANYVNNKKNEDGTYVADTNTNKVGINAQRSVQQLNKQYNNTINQAYANNLLANNGLRISSLGSGYKEAYIQKLQASVNEEVNQASMSVADVKQNIFDSLSESLGTLSGLQQQEVNNMRRTAGSIEEYYDYLGTLTNETGSFRSDAHGFKTGDAYTFEDNYDRIFGLDKGQLAGYTDYDNNQALAFEDWVRQTSGTSDGDTAWMDWLYSSGMNQYKDFIKNGVNSVYSGVVTNTTKTDTALVPDKPNTPTNNTWLDITKQMINKHGIFGGS